MWQLLLCILYYLPNDAKIVVFSSKLTKKLEGLPFNIELMTSSTGEAWPLLVVNGNNIATVELTLYLDTMQTTSQLCSTCISLYVNVMLNKC